MVAWKDFQPKNFAYTLDVANARQTIEAGIKKTKQVFCLHKLKVRSEPAIFLQEAFRQKSSKIQKVCW